MKFKLDREKINKFLPFLVCVLIAFIVWIFVMYIQAPEYSREFEDIPVYVRDIPSRFEDCEIEILEKEGVSANFYGTNVALAKCDNGKIYGTVNLTKFSEPGSYEADVVFNYPPGATLYCRDSVKVHVEIRPPQLYTSNFSQIPITMETESDAAKALLKKYNITPSISAVDVKLSSYDEALLSVAREDVKAFFDISDINVISAGIYNSVKVRFTCGDVEEFEGTEIYISVQVSEKEQQAD